RVAALLDGKELPAAAAAAVVGMRGERGTQENGNDCQRLHQYPTLLNRIGKVTITTPPWGLGNESPRRTSRRHETTSPDEIVADLLRASPTAPFASMVHSSRTLPAPRFGSLSSWRS